MIAAVAVVPSAPALLPRYTGRVDVLAEVRTAAVEAVRTAISTPGVERVVLIAATDREPRHTMPPLGQRVGEYLLSLAQSPADAVQLVPWDAPVAECRARGAEIAAGSAPSGLEVGEESSRPVTGGVVSAAEAGGASSVLVVVADGSARRGEKAPGYLDDRAFGFDDALVAALRDADPAALLALDATLAADLLAHGRAPLQVAAAAMAGTSAPGAEATASAADFHATDAAPLWRCERLDEPDPFGVLYAVAQLRRVG
ncbi:MAG: hypothetical protein ACRCXL_15005 [Dermatophilaceae bacterium]